MVFRWGNWKKAPRIGDYRQSRRGGQRERERGRERERVRVRETPIYWITWSDNKLVCTFKCVCFSYLYMCMWLRNSDQKHFDYRHTHNWTENTSSVLSGPSYSSLSFSQTHTRACKRTSHERHNSSFKYKVKGCGAIPKLSSAKKFKQYHALIQIYSVYSLHSIYCVHQKFGAVTFCSFSGF